MAVKKSVQRIAISYYKTKFKLLATISKRKAAEKAFELFCTPQSRKNKKPTKIFESGEKLHFPLEGSIVRGWRFNPVRTPAQKIHSDGDHPRPYRHGQTGGHPAEKKVLILHGWESSVTNFDKYINLFVKKGYEVLAFDAPAHGGSGGKKITAPLYKDMIMKIHKQFGPVNSFLAHSFGGLAVSLALEELNDTKNIRLALIAPATETTTALNSFFNFLAIDEGVRREFDKVIIEKGGRKAEWYSIKRAMKNIKAKVLWIQDEEDIVTPLSDAMNVKNENYTNIEFVITKGLGHSKIYRDNKIIDTVVNYL